MLPVGYCESLRELTEAHCLAHSKYSLCCFHHCYYLVWLKAWGWEDAETEAREVNGDLLVQLKNMRAQEALQSTRSHLHLGQLPLAVVWNVGWSK